MTEPRISDIPSIKKILEEVNNLKSVKAALPLLRPFLKLLGGDINSLDEAFAKVEEMERVAAELSTIPDRFNDTFAPRGWILYDMLNIEVAKGAVYKAEAGDIDGAEQDLVEYYDEKTINSHIAFMMGVKVFRPRIPLARKALTDYVEERYHASVPVVLMLLDGMVNDLGGMGFFTQGVKLEAWDSIAAHSKGLAVLSKVLGEGRYKTTTDPVSLPYRNGILHGMDLSYDNKMVAAKAWAALFSARDWALKVEQGKVKAPPEEPKKEKTLGELFSQLRDMAKDKAALDAWVPRTIQPGIDVPLSGIPADYGDGTPEQKLVSFLTFWQSRNFGYMAKCVPFMDKKYIGNRLPASLRQYYENKRFKSFELLEVTDNALTVTTIKASIVYEHDENIVEKVVDFHIVKEDADGKPALPSRVDSEWVIYTFRV